MADSTQTIVDMETRFWKALVNRDTGAAAAMIADECLITGPSGRCGSIRASTQP